MGVQEITRNIFLVNETANRSDGGISQTRDQAQELSTLSSSLDTNISDFKI